MHKFLTFLMIALLPMLASAAPTEFSAKVDRTSLSVEETLTLRLRFHEQVMFGEPDISQLDQNFDVLGKHRNQQYRSVNGKAESWTQWQITLSPKREGKLLIPSFEFKGAYTDAIEIEVKKAPVYSGKMANQPVFMEVDLDKSSVFVQEQVIYTMRLFTSVDLHSLNRTDLDLGNALGKKISENQYQRNIAGKPYLVVEIKYALFPQESGTLTVPSSLWSVVLNQQSYRRDPFFNDPFGRGGKKINLRVPEKSVTVMPQPASFAANHPNDAWMPASKVALEQRWSQSPDSFKVGEPITRTIVVTAKGLTAAQLAPLNIETINGVSYYPDQPQSEEKLSSDGITTVTQESYAIVANKPGTITLPAVVVRWWDTDEKRIKEAQLPVQEIRVAPAANSALPAVPAIQTPAPADNNPANAPREENGGQAVSSIWFYSTLISGIVAMIFMALWLVTRHRLLTLQQDEVNTAGAPAPKAKGSLKQAMAALDKGDPRSARQAMIHWAQSHFNNPQLTRLEQLGQLAEDANFSQSLTALDNQMFGNEEQRLPPALAQALKQGLEALQQKSAAPSDDSALPSLYR